jgi:hypothetical protein
LQSPLVRAASAVQETALLLQAKAQVHLLVASQLPVAVAVERVVLQEQKLMVHPAEDQDTTARPPVAVLVLQEPVLLVRVIMVGTPLMEVTVPAVAVEVLAVLVSTPLSNIKVPEVESV